MESVKNPSALLLNTPESIAAMQQFFEQQGFYAQSVQAALQPESAFSKAITKALIDNYGSDSTQKLEMAVLNIRSDNFAAQKGVFGDRERLATAWVQFRTGLPINGVWNERTNALIKTKEAQEILGILNPIKKEVGGLKEEIVREQKAKPTQESKKSMGELLDDIFETDKKEIKPVVRGKEIPKVGKNISETVKKYNFPKKFITHGQRFGPDDMEDQYWHMCASYVSYLLGKPLRDAWKAGDNVLKFGGKEIENMFSGISIPKDLDTEEKITDFIEKRIKQYGKIDISQIREGDVLQFYYPPSDWHETAYEQGQALTRTQAMTTHLGVATLNPTTGKLNGTNNNPVYIKGVKQKKGVIHSLPLEDYISGNNKTNPSKTRLVAVFRLP